MKLLAKTFHGLENVLAKELAGIGATNITPQRRAVAFEGDKEVLYKANLHLRTALRILVPIYNFKADTEIELYNKIHSYDWSQHMSNKQTFAIDSVAFGDIFNHSKFLSLKAKDAIVDQFREKTGDRPSVDAENPDISINIHVSENKFTVSLDSSGESLHRRGYRDSRHKAPLNEALAAGMILLAEWSKETPLYDPMCGSGTIVMEAAMIACNIPPAWHRKHFCFMAWKDFDKDLWKSIRDEAEKKIEHPRTYIAGNDIDMKAVDMAKLASLEFRLNREISITKGAFEEQDPPFRRGIIITNPPYGERLKKTDIFAFYKKIGSTLKHKYAGYDVWVISSNEDAIYRIGLKTSEKHILYNGPLECQYLKYELFDGSLKERKKRQNLKQDLDK